MKPILSLLILTTCLGPVFAGEDDPLTLLQRLDGDWQLTFLQIDEGGTYRTVGTSDSRITVKLGGKLILEETVIKTATSEFPLLVVYSYDRVRNVYRKASTDGVTGLMDIQEGYLDDGILHLTNTHRQTWFVGASGKEIAFRITFDLNKADEPIMVADLSADKGQTWHKFQKVLYQRAPARAAGTP